MVHVFEQKYLGVTVDCKLSFEEHISAKIRVANAIVGVIRRSFTFLDGSTFKRIYIAFVRFHIEYAQSVCINSLENVRIRATKLVDGLGDMEYNERSGGTNLPTLAY